MVSEDYSKLKALLGEHELWNDVTDTSLHMYIDLARIFNAAVRAGDVLVVAKVSPQLLNTMKELGLTPAAYRAIRAKIGSKKKSDAFTGLLD